MTVSTPQATGFSIDQRKPMSGFENAKTALQSSQVIRDKAFQSPLQNIASGNSQDNLEASKGFAKGAMQTFSSMGAQNAGPVGKDMLAHAPAFAQNINQLNTALQPTNQAQAFGQGSEKVAELAVPTKMASDATPGIMGKLTTWLKTKFGTRPLKEVVTTAEEDLHKLNPVERKAYFDNQKMSLDKKYSDVEQKIAKESGARQAALKQESDDLSKQLSTASRDETLALRPKVVTAMGKQSQEYRRLVDEAITPLKDTEVDAGELRSFITAKFSDNPDEAASMIQRLGMKADDTTATIGNIHKKVISLSSDMSAAAKKGSRVYTPEEKKIDDTISTVTDFLKTKGLDLSEPRQFWAQYAPIRNQMVTEIKPFNQAGNQTKLFDNTLSRVVQGKDVSNENFISSIEDILGEKIGQEPRNIVAKMAQNEKSVLATEIEKQTKLAETALAKERAALNLSEKEFEVERKARIRKAIKVAIAGAVAYKANSELKARTGLGL